MFRKTAQELTLAEIREKLREIIAELKKPFPPDAHKERDLPGGDQWFYIPWQDIRERLEEVCPTFEVVYSDPIYLGDITNEKTYLCSIRCGITILGQTRWAVGNAPVIQMSSRGKDMSRGTPIQRATAHAFKNAAEAWGVGRYLDDQIGVTRLLKGRAIAVVAKNRTQYTRETGQISREEWLKLERSN
jgi:hypothetical protein